MTESTEHFTEDRPALDEPEEGWVEAPTLVDTQVLTIALCRFTGDRPERETGRCLQRQLRLHEDVDCVTLYHQADALRNGLVHYELPATEVTAPVEGGEPTYQNPLRS
jgi:hypothetical protein